MIQSKNYKITTDTGRNQNFKILLKQRLIEKNHESFAGISFRLYWPSFTREFDLSKIELGSEIILVCNKKCKNKRIKKSLVPQYNLNSF